MDITIHKLNKVYRGNVQALQDLELSIPSGMFGLLGPNGAGKTTLMRILTGILHASSGEIWVGSYDGTSERGRTEIKRTLGYLPQDLGMYPDLSAYEFLDYMGLLKGLEQRQQRKRQVEELLELVSLGDVASRKIKTFSGGMKRRVGIAQALLNNPQLLIVDEPTAGLDPEERIRFRNLLSDLGSNRTVLLSTHIVEDIAQTCQRIAVMKNGSVIYQGTIDQLLQQTKGKVWQITAGSGNRPQGNFTIVSTQNAGNTLLYRVVGQVPPNVWPTTPLEPNLEDGYVWAMHAPQGQQAEPYMV